MPVFDTHDSSRPAESVREGVGYPSIDEIATDLRKPEQANLPRFWAPFLYVQTRLTWLLLRLGINSRQCTVIWALLSVISFAVFLLGVPWAFVLGTLLFNLYLTLDGVDGEMGRFEKRLMTAEEDLRTHINGIYLDRVSHAIVTVLWPLGISFGLYISTGKPLVVLAGAALAVFHNVIRTHYLMEQYIKVFFRDLVHETFAARLSAKSFCMPDKRDNLLVRRLRMLEYWMSSSRYYSIFVLIWSGIDMVQSPFGPPDYPTLYFWILFSGALSPILAVRVIRRTVRAETILNEILREP